MTLSSAVDQKVSLAVSTVIFALRPHPTSGMLTVWLPLVRRIREPHEGSWALPGGPLEPHEDLAASAQHTLDRTTGLTPRYLEQLYSFGAIDRSPTVDRDGRVVSVVYWALVRPDEVARAVAKAEEVAAEQYGENVQWFVADEVPTLAFDHNEILEYALKRLRAKITYSPIAFAFCNDEFTLAELREVHEAVLCKQIDPANFRRQVLATHAVAPTGAFVQGTSHRPPALYRLSTQLEESR
ncbi:MAG: NUDIX domain-containing protein [Aeromicrobium sp.]|uniref:NUDIX hydrolase n=1 Tax=Aeromicrobium sp. TaxID=1871063 RepID=UPI003C63D6AD